MELLIILVFLVTPIAGFIFGYKVFTAKMENKAARIVLSFLCAVGSVCLLVGVLFGACMCAMNYH